jgi:hypothetical protein
VEPTLRPSFPGEGEGSVATDGSKEVPVPARKSTTTKTPGRIAKKSTAKKSTAKKQAASKTTANTAAKRATGKTSAAKRVPQKASSTKRAAKATTAAPRSSSSTASARRGDLIILDSAHVGSAAREGEIVKVIEGEVSVSYQVRWPDGHETLITPAPGAARVVRT